MEGKSFITSDARKVMKLTIQVVRASNENFFVCWKWKGYWEKRMGGVARIKCQYSGLRSDEVQRQDNITRQGLTCGV